MRILLVTMSMDIGGAETHILELAKELKRRKNDVFVISKGGKYVEELATFGIEHIVAPLSDKNPIHMIQSYRILKRVITEKKIELVHSHTRITSFICGLLQKKLQFPYVTTAHWTFKVTPLLKKISNWGEATIAVSEDIKEYLIQNYHVDPQKIIVTVNGIDTEKFSKETNYQDVMQEFSLKEDASRIVSISRLDESRALVAKQLVSITPQLAQKVERLEVVIVGGGDQFETISKQANEVNEQLGRNVITMTNSRTDINQFAACGTVFVGVSRAALEAMASEKPVIVAGNEGYLGIFDETKLDKAIETNFCCRGLPFSDEKVLERDILTLLSQQNLSEMGAYNRKIVKDFYSVEKMTNDCQKAYEMVKK